MLTFQRKRQGFAAVLVTLQVLFSAAIAEGQVAPADRTIEATSASSNPDSQLEELAGWELPDWKRHETGDTGRLAHGCGLTVEASLSTTGRVNYVNIALANQERRNLSVYTTRVTASFDDGGPVALDSLNLPTRETSVVFPNSYLHWRLRFPNKSVFAHADRIRLALPVASDGDSTCTIFVAFERDRTVPRAFFSYEKITRYSFEVFGGKRLPGTSGIRSIAPDSGKSGGVGLSYYFGRNVGVSVEIELDGFGSAGSTAIVGKREFKATPTVSGAVYSAGLPLRLVFPPLALIYTPSLGVEAFEFKSTDERDPTETNTLFLLQHRLRLFVTVLTLQNGMMFAIGPNFAHRYLPYGHLGGADLSGHLFVGGLTFLVGGG
jgi:hypothetical protein